MDMDMRYGLASVLAYINANVETGDSQIMVLNTTAHCDQHLMNRNNLELSQLEVINDVPFRNN
jgi:hypothetical protein